jgi:hypothetical protein
LDDEAAAEAECSPMLVLVAVELRGIRLARGGTLAW